MFQISKRCKYDDNQSEIIVSNYYIEMLSMAFVICHISFAFDLGKNQITSVDKSRCQNLLIALCININKYSYMKYV